MRQRPSIPAPGPADDQIVIIVRKNNASGLSALLIAVLLAAGVFWISQGGQSKAAVPVTTQGQANTPVPAGKQAKLKTAPASGEAPAIAVPASAPTQPAGPFGRPGATFFEPTTEPEVAPEAP
ncbi:MAG: hypothetical protein EOP87_04225 [Verrucomicrobiaceae bacterium]|nr:MAG: hypothetical protein EOP87_04225 [Verrucomicrobiaceae bacterium]